MSFVFGQGGRRFPTQTWASAHPGRLHVQPRRRHRSGRGAAQGADAGPVLLGNTICYFMGSTGLRHFLSRSRWASFVAWRSRGNLLPVHAVEPEALGSLKAWAYRTPHPGHDPAARAVVGVSVYASAVGLCRLYFETISRPRRSWEGFTCTSSCVRRSACSCGESSRWQAW